MSYPLEASKENGFYFLFMSLHSPCQQYHPEHGLHPNSSFIFHSLVLCGSQLSAVTDHHFELLYSITLKTLSSDKKALLIFMFTFRIPNQINYFFLKCLRIMSWISVQSYFISYQQKHKSNYIMQVKLIQDFFLPELLHRIKRTRITSTIPKKPTVRTGKKYYLQFEKRHNQSKTLHRGKSLLHGENFKSCPWEIAQIINFIWLPKTQLRHQEIKTL